MRKYTVIVDCKVQYVVDAETRLDATAAAVARHPTAKRIDAKLSAIPERFNANQRIEFLRIQDATADRIAQELAP